MTEISEFIKSHAEDEYKLKDIAIIFHGVMEGMRAECGRFGMTESDWDDLCGSIGVSFLTSLAVANMSEGDAMEFAIRLMDSIPSGDA